MLESMARIGLVLTPKLNQWSESLDDGSTSHPIVVATKRICFTYLRETELAQHAKTFGRFAIEWDVSALRQLGVLPVLYIPRTEGTPTDDYSGTHEAMLVRLAEVQAVLELFRDTPDVDISGVRPMDELIGALAAFSGLFAQMGPDTNGSMAYYSEREWRIVAGAHHHSLGELTTDLSASDKNAVASINPSFFRKVVEFRSGQHERIEQCKVCSTFNGDPILRTARRVTVPAANRSTAERVLRDAGLTELPVVEAHEVAE